LMQISNRSVEKKRADNVLELSGKESSERNK
jgi:hypothetical protein